MSKLSGPTQGTVVRICTCKHEYQDKKYGPGKRVHNVAAGKSSHSCKCTVCSSTK